MRMQKILTENSSCLDLQRDTSKRTKLSSLCKEEAQQCCRNCYIFCCAINCQTTNSLEITPTLIWQDWILMKNYRGSSSRSMMTTRTFDLTSWKKYWKKYHGHSTTPLHEVHYQRKNIIPGLFWRRKQTNVKKEKETSAFSLAFIAFLSLFLSFSFLYL